MKSGASRLIKEILSDLIFRHPFKGGLSLDYTKFEREASVENGISVIEEKPSVFLKKSSSFVPRGKSTFIVKYYVGDANNFKFGYSEKFDTLPKAMSFYASKAFEATNNYRK